MYKTILKPFILVFYLLIAYSCSTDESIPNNEQDFNTITYETIKGKSREADDQMSQILFNKYGIETTVISETEYSFKYPDGRVLNGEILENEIRISGTKINNLSYSFDKLTEEEINGLDNNSEYLLSSNLLKETFILNVNDFTNLSEEETGSASPCDEHPSLEEFNDCFWREWDEFCDGFAGCVAQATNAPFIAAVISVHCAAC